MLGAKAKQHDLRHKEHAQDSECHRRKLQFQMPRQISVPVTNGQARDERCPELTSRSACFPLLLSASSLPKMTRCENTQKSLDHCVTYVGNTATAPMYMKPPATNGITCAKHVRCGLEWRYSKGNPRDIPGQPAEPWCQVAPRPSAAPPLQGQSHWPRPRLTWRGCEWRFP